jgi:hypothetical protein
LDTTSTNTDQVLQSAHEWWNALEAQWKTAFNEGVLNLGKKEDIPGDEDLIYLFRDAENIRLAGPKAPHPNISFELTNLSGVVGLSKLNFLSVSDQAIETLSELAEVQNLRSLFVQNNKLTSLEGIEGNKELINLYAQGNSITSIAPVRNLLKLQTLNVSGNEITSLDGITLAHSDEMRKCYVLPNDNLRDRDVLKLQNECGIIARKS